MAAAALRTQAVFFGVSMGLYFVGVSFEILYDFVGSFRIFLKHRRRRGPPDLESAAGGPANF